MGVFDHKNHDCNKLELAADATDAAKSLAKWVQLTLFSPFVFLSRTAKASMQNHFSKRYGAHAQAMSIQAKLAPTYNDLKAKLEKDFGL